MSPSTTATPAFPAMKRIATDPRPPGPSLPAGADGPRVVAIGGGHGLAQALTAARSYAGRIDAVVSVADDGGSSGRLVPALAIPPPGDIRKCLVALAGEDSTWRRLFEHRFAGSDVAGHSLGNLILAALTEIEGSFEGALRTGERLLGAVGSVIPAAGEPLRLEATIDGVVVTGQATIARSRGRITDVQVVPRTAVAAEPAVEAIAAADQIVLGPGSLFTSVMASLRVPGITEAVNAAPGQVVYVANLITQDGETIGMDAAGHVDALRRLTGLRAPAAIVANDAALDVDAPLEPVRIDGDLPAAGGAEILSADLVDRAAAWPQHDPAKLGAALGELLGALDRLNDDER